MIRKNKETLGEKHIGEIENDVEEKPWQIKFFGDRWLMQIFVSLMNTPKSAKQISQETEITINSVYRRLKKLERRGLLERSGIITHDGGKTFLYQS